MSTEKEIRIKQKIDTAENWQQYNPILLDREIGVDSTNRKIKIGDGIASWNDLPYSSAIRQYVPNGGDMLGNNIAISKNSFATATSI